MADANDFERFYRDSLVPTLTIDLEARQIVDVNQATINMLGLELDEIIGRPGADFLDEPASDELFRVRGIRGDTTRAVRRVRTVLGVRTAEINMVPAGFPGQIFVQVVDMTDILEANRKLDDQAAWLLRKTAALESLTSRVAHDVKGPLASILGFSSLLEKRFDDLDADKRTMMLQRIGATGRSLSTMVDNMVREALDGPLSSDASHDPEVLAETIRGIYEADLVSVGGTLRFVSAVDVMPVPASVLRQPLVNLVGNSIKFCDPAKPLSIVVEIAIAADGSLTIEVEDNGRGFDVEPETLFRRGVRGGNVADAVGTGLGLAFTRTAIEDVGGRVEAFHPNGDAEAGGAGFRITIPLLVDEPIDAPIGGSAATGLSMQQLAGMLDSTPVPMLVIDFAATAIVRVNDACERLLGLSAERILGRPGREFLVAPEQADQLRSDYTGSTTQPAAFDTEVIHADGHHMPARILLGGDDESTLSIVQVLPLAAEDVARVWPRQTAVAGG